METKFFLSPSYKYCPEYNASASGSNLKAPTIVAIYLESQSLSESKYIIYSPLDSFNPIFLDLDTPRVSWFKISFILSSPILTTLSTVESVLQSSIIISSKFE